MRTLLVLLATLATLAGCHRAGTPAANDTPVDAGGDGGEDASPPCFTNPQTYLEIINACTDAEAIDKTDDLSQMNLADGGLQPLP
jgi:predicted small lipoprotein YifL